MEYDSFIVSWSNCRACGQEYPDHLLKAGRCVACELRLKPVIRIRRVTRKRYVFEVV